jgi:anti-sigma regulatory factor (Ser/Thr protein kinase)
MLEPSPQSVAKARSFVLSAVPVVDEETRQRLAALTSELVTNAVVHAKTPFVVEVVRGPAVIRVAVTDGDTQVVELRSYEPVSPAGRGLHIVSALADRWGVDPSPTGKTVWFEVRPDQASA